jgi:hypothetical protein
VPRCSSVEDFHISHDINADMSHAKNMDVASVGYSGQVPCIVYCLTQVANRFPLVFALLT